MKEGSSGKVAFYTLGCKLNFAETATIARQFAERGYEQVGFGEKADVYIINSCTVTAQADKKCRTAIRRAIRQAPGAFVAVAGCYAQLQAEEIKKIRGVDAILGTQEKFRLFDLYSSFDKQEEPEVLVSPSKKAEAFEPAYSTSGRTRSFLKIQDGCDYFCSYCTIPFARGRSRSGTIAGTVERAREIAASGIREIVLTGVNIGEFGRKQDETFLELLRELDKVEGIDRYRISSIEPNLIDDDIIDFVAGSSKFLPHFHIPLQSGSDKILKLMQRKYNTSLFAGRVDRIRKVMPLAGIGTDVIVGFPGETDEDFEETYRFLSSLDLSYLHVFSFSSRKNTRAAAFSGMVDPTVIEQRSNRLHLLSERKRIGFAARNTGRRADVLFESKEKDGMISGWTENYLKVVIPFREALIGEIREVKLATADSEGVISAVIPGH
ncbi:MAG: tRNA (N(6)-L-threonylcarbamoyladenosine(37)-C(2))-methylthiotransferase MtaB [Bacteroidota bacterium]